MTTELADPDSPSRRGTATPESRRIRARCQTRSAGLLEAPAEQISRSILSGDLRGIPKGGDALGVSTNPEVPDHER